MKRNYRERFRAYRERLSKRLRGWVKRNRLAGLRVLQPLIIVTTIIAISFVWWLTMVWMIEYLPYIEQPLIAMILAIGFMAVACTFMFVFVEIIRTNILKGW